MIQKENELTTILGRHIDALTVSVKFEFPACLKRILDAAKEQAREDDGGKMLLVDNMTGVPGGAWYIRAKGRATYQYVIENASFYIELSVMGHLPSLVVQFKAATLYEYEPESYEVFVERLARYFIGPKLSCSHWVSRCDLAVDFQEPNFTLPEMADVITRARDRTVNYKGDRANTLTLGKRHGGLQAQIYNKSEELLTSDKAWMYEVWRASEQYQEGYPVWRCEVRWFRQGLRSLEVTTLGDLLASLGDLACLSVGESSGSWLRIADPDSRHKESQDRGVASWWSAVQSALKSGLLASGRKRKGYDPRPSLDRCIKLAGSAMTRAAALHRIGYDSKTPLDPARFAAWVGWQYQKRLALDGITWPDRVNARTLELRGVAWVA
jgi:hypothetical protein